MIQNYTGGFQILDYHWIPSKITQVFPNHWGASQPIWLSRLISQHDDVPKWLSRLISSMTTYLRHVSTIYANLTALYSIGQSVQVGLQKIAKALNSYYPSLSGSGAVGDGGLLLPVWAHDREAEREVRGKHARQRGCRQGTDAPSHPLPCSKLWHRLLCEVGNPLNLANSEFLWRIMVQTVIVNIT